MKKIPFSQQKSNHYSSVTQPTAQHPAHPNNNLKPQPAILYWELRLNTTGSRLLQNVGAHVASDTV